MAQKPGKARRAAIAWQVTLLLATPIAAFAQTPATASASGAEGISVAVGYEIRADHLRYTFENPSNFDTDYLVPHSFTQSYEADNGWLTGNVRYPIARQRFATELGITPERVTRASDFDTFYNPGSDVIVYGTDGDARLRSFEIAQWSETTLSGTRWRVGYRYRRDRSEFLPADIIITHSNPPREERRLTTDRETTISELHEIPVEISRDITIGRDWTLRVDGRAAPFVWGQLTTILPDKYPGQDIVFSAHALGYGGGIELLRAAGRLTINASVRYDHTSSYSDARQLTMNSLRFGVALQR